MFCIAKTTPGDLNFRKFSERGALSALRATPARFAHKLTPSNEKSWLRPWPQTRREEGHGGGGGLSRGEIQKAPPLDNLGGPRRPLLQKFRGPQILCVYPKSAVLGIN